MQAPVPALPSHSEITSNNVESLSDTSLLRDDLTDGIKALLLRNRIERVARENETQGIRTSVDIFDMQTNRTIVKHNESSVHFAASVNKLPVAWLVQQDLRASKLKLNQTITWQASDVRAGYGVYDQPGAATSATVEQLLFDMLNYSGNTAVRVLVNYTLDGAANVNTRLAEYPQIPNTRLQPLDATRFYVGNSTSKESVWIINKLLAKNDKYTRVIKNALSTNIFANYGVRSQLEGNDYVVLANKVGILDDVDGNNRHDVGIIYNTRTHKAYGYSFMTTTPYENTPGTVRAEESLGLMGHNTLRYAGDKPQRTNQEQKVAPFSAPTLQPETKVLY